MLVPFRLILLVAILAVLALAPTTRVTAQSCNPSVQQCG